jgi:hypothetical protein
MAEACTDYFKKSREGFKASVPSVIREQEKGVKNA